MTAEIAILNKEAVALAADSAVTIGFGEKIYNSANKLFCLSYFQPIGIMISGNAQYMDIPWETIIKTYRKELCHDKFKTVKEYAKHFIQSLINHKIKFNHKIKDRNTKTLINSLLYNLAMETKNNYDAIKNSKDNSFKNYKEYVEQIIDERMMFINKRNNLKCFSKIFFSNFLRKYNNYIFENTKKKFKDFDKKYTDKIYNYVITYLKKDVFIDTPYTEIVFSGFGTEELLPSICSYKVDGLLNGQLRYNIAEDSSIGETRSMIIPFAQRDMVDMFMQGVDVGYQRTQESYMKKALEDYTEFLLSSAKEFKEVNENRKKILKKNIFKSNKKLLDQLKLDLENIRKHKFQDPITSNTSFLPKDELANMAESLVNLTSFKRKVSLTKETVGGPIDVAVITKGDGFIWIKRKHYFDPKYNHHYFRKYYHGIMEEDEYEKKGN